MLTLYVIPDCPHCESARSKLLELGLSFIESDVTKDYKSLRAMYKLSRQKLVPVLALDKTFLVRPSMTEIRDLVRIDA